MDLNQLIGHTRLFLKQNAPAILTAVGVVGTATTAYFVGKASFEAADDLDRAYLEDKAQVTTQDKAKLVWKRYIPAAISGTITVTAIVMAAKVGNRQTAAAVSAYAISERAFSTYRDKVVERIGEKKEEALRDEIVQERVHRLPPTSEVLMLGEGEVLCCELLTMRYFKCDAETLRRAEIEINAEMNSGIYSTLSAFYDLVGLRHTSYSDNHGWDNAKLMKLTFSSAITENERPCLTFEYNYVKPL